MSIVFKFFKGAITVALSVTTFVVILAFARKASAGLAVLNNKESARTANIMGYDLNAKNDEVVTGNDVVNITKEWQLEYDVVIQTLTSLTTYNKNNTLQINQLGTNTYVAPSSSFLLHFRYSDNGNLTTIYAIEEGATLTGSFINAVSKLLNDKYAIAFVRHDGISKYPFRTDSIEQVSESNKYKLALYFTNSGDVKYIAFLSEGVLKPSDIL